MHFVELPYPNDAGGQIATRGLEYQTSYAMILAIDFCKEKKRFYLRNEWYDDITVINCLESPSFFLFYQIKSGAQQTIATITQEKSGKQSILSKALSNFNFFPDKKIHVELCSENGFNFSSQERLTLQDLQCPPKTTKAVKNRLKAQKSQVSDDTHESFWFTTGKISAKNHVEQCESYLAHFINDNFAETRINQIALTTAILEQIRTKATKTHPTMLPLSIDQFVSHKEFGRWIKTAVREPNQRPLEQFFPNIDSFPPLTRHQYRATWRTINSTTDTTIIKSIESTREKIWKILCVEEYQSHTVSEFKNLVDQNVERPVSVTSIMMDLLFYDAFTNGPETPEHPEIDQYFTEFEKW